MKDIWETFWDNARYVGKNKFIKKRRFYEPEEPNQQNLGYYWDEVNVDDMATVLMAIKENWTHDSNW